MSDPAAEPGAPTGGATNMPSSSEKSIANEVKERVPDKAISIARTPDRLILRLNKYALRLVFQCKQNANIYPDCSLARAG